MSRQVHRPVTMTGQSRHIGDKETLHRGQLLVAWVATEAIYLWAEKA